MKRTSTLILAVLLSVPALAFAYTTARSHMVVVCPECGPVPTCPVSNPSCDPSQGQ
jgi:hypothetical protein